MLAWLKRTLFGPRWSQAEQIYKSALEDYRAGRLDAALEKFDTARTIAHTLGEIRPEAAAMRDIGVCYAAQGQPQAAMRAYRDSLELFRQIGDDDGTVGVLQNLALVSRAVNDWPSAITSLDEMVLLYRKMRRPADESAALNDLGATLNDAGRPDEALAQLERALALLRPMGKRQEVAMALHNKARAHQLRGEAALAKETRDESARIFAEDAKGGV